MKFTARAVLVFSLVLFGSVFLAAQDKSQVNVKYDKKKDLTTVKLKPFRVSRLILEKESTTSIPLHQTDLEISYSFQGEKPVKVDNVTLRFVVTGNNYIFLRPQAAMAVLDNEAGSGRAFALGNSDYKSYQRFSTVLEETLVVTAPAEALSRMAKANSLQIYLGPVAYTITPSQLQGIKALAEQLPAEPTTAKSN